MDASGTTRGESDYQGKLALIARAILEWRGDFVLVSHVDPDGDALGSALSLKRALEELGRRVTLPLEAPRYLQFLASEGELSPPLERLGEDSLLVVLDVADAARAAGAPLEGAGYTINIDHHGGNGRFGDLALVEPAKAATALIVKELIGALGVPLDARIATPCLAGLITDTGNFRFANTSPDALAGAAELLAAGVDFVGLTDRLQLRHPDYFRKLARVMATVEFPLQGLAVMARLTAEMRRDIGESEDDSEDYVGLIRYAEGSVVAIFLTERDGFTKVSVRSREGVSAQAICRELGGGGHLPAAGARVAGGVEEARRQVLAATRRELQRRGLLEG